MKPMLVFLSILLITMIACNLTEFNKDGKSITPSSNIITETREVSGFTGVDMRTIGTVTITQGESESLVIEGSDNLVPLVKTRVVGDVLIIEMDENLNVETLKKENVLIFTITVKDLTSLVVSGLGEVDMNTLTTDSLKLTMSGAGVISFTELSAKDVTINVSGVGNVIVSGTASHLNAEISGAGEINAADLECQTANVEISGLGTAVVWVTDELTGTISGGGSVRYYGDPQTHTTSTGVGRFESLGSK